MTTEELAEAEEWASMPFDTEELALILGLRPEQLRLALDDPDNALGNAVKRGRLLAKAELFKKIKTLSNQGSGPAQLMLKNLLARVEL
ncbi:MAG TPA: hypothetical protein PLB89_04745 [Flavobacteriales bacterium]|nr:hypothetical protein [Flavobacteriales bacterium]